MSAKQGLPARREKGKLIIHILQRRITGIFGPGDMPYSARETYVQLINFPGGDGLR